MKAANRGTRRGEDVHPPADITAGIDGVHLALEMPGAVPETISVTVEDDVLTVSAERTALGDGLRVLRRETHPGCFRRSFRLSRDLGRDGLTADYKLGVLEVRVPRAEHTIPRKIDVRIEA